MLRNRFWYGVLRFPAGADGGTGGGNGGQPDIAKLIADGLAAVKADLSTEFNKGINALDKRFKGLDERFEAFKTNGNGGDGGNGGGGNGGEGGNGGGEGKEAKTIAELNIKLNSLEKQVKTANDTVTSERELRVKAEGAAKEEKRLNLFTKAIEDIPFASAKARQQFIDAYYHKVVWDEEGTNLIVKTDKGDVGHDVYLSAEAQDSPHLMASSGQGGSGASGGQRPGSRVNKNILTMSTEDILKLPKDEQNAIFAQNLEMATQGH